MKRKVEMWQLLQRQSLSLEQKIIMSKQRIKAWHEHYDGEVFVSFSGGLDSTVLLHLVRTMYPDVLGVFVNTGLEYPENVRHVKRTDNVLIVRPERTFKVVIEKLGYPVVSKRTSQYVHEVQTAKGYTATKRLRLTGYTSAGRYSKMSKIANKWQYLCDAPFKIGERCCHWLKKKPLKKASIEYGAPILGTRVEEAQQRKMTYLEHGCNGFEMKAPRSTPLAFWTAEDISEYIRRFDVP